MKLSTILILFCVSNVVLAENSCDLTDEYKILRLKVYRDAKETYESCRNSVSQYFYGRGVTECESEGGSSKVKGGCYHTAGYTMGVDLEKKHKHCEILKPDIEQTKEFFKELVIEKKIRMCVGNAVNRPGIVGG